ncbi:hypothetical protein NIBR502773_00085 [Pseudomonas sp. NIBRBAC000502773]|nr:hypothetical protein NIBR502773_00085 [Pseudomonas sp. NIBRBAC000502773]
MYLCHVPLLPLSDAACRTAKPKDRPYGLFDGDGLFLLIQPNGRKGWRVPKPARLRGGRDGINPEG